MSKCQLRFSVIFPEILRLELGSLSTFNFLTRTTTTNQIFSTSSVCSTVRNTIELCRFDWLI